MLTAIVYQNYSKVKKKLYRIKARKLSLIYMYSIGNLRELNSRHVITNNPQFFDSRKTFKIKMKYNRKNINSL